MAEEALAVADTAAYSKIATAAAASAVTEVAKGATNALVKAFMESVAPYFSDKKAKQKIILGLHKYSRNIEFRTRCVPTIAIKGGEFVLDQVYEPLRLSRMGGGVEIKIENYPTRLFVDSRCVVVVDSAGMGKSTLTKYLIRRCLFERKKIPLLVELRRIRSGQRIVDFICEEVLGSKASEQVTEDFKQSIKEGNYLFLLDGYDEVAPEAREAISIEISRISSDYQYCNFWLTSRPDPALAGFSEFGSFEISPLSYSAACSLLRRYDQGRGIAPALIEKLSALPHVHEFLGNPLLVTLLYKAFDYKATIPIRRNIFFRQVFEALYQDHDLSKEGAFERRKKSALDVDDFHKFLRALGFLTFKSGRVQYDQAQFVDYIKRAAEKAQLIFDCSRMKADLLSAVPIFVMDGNEVRWSHKAFQDYFASQFIYFDSGSARDEIVSRIFTSDFIGRYENTLLLLAEMDIGMVREICVLPFLKSVGVSDAFVDEVEYAVDYLDGVGEFYLIKGFHPARNSSVDEAMAEIRRVNDQPPEWYIRRMTYSPKDGVAVAQVAQLSPADSLKHELVAKLDPATFQIKRSRVSLSDFRDSGETKVVNVNEVLRDTSSSAEDRRRMIDLLVQLTGACIPVANAISGLERYVAERRSARVADSLLEGL